jgi:Fic family protein
MQKIETTPDYRRIFEDIIDLKYPHKKESCSKILNKNDLSILDVIKLNSMIFDHQNGSADRVNQQYRSYNTDAILEILEYQQKNKLNNSQLANHFKLSRNTVTKWKKMFPGQ